jgi:hypothetical protein
MAKCCEDPTEPPKLDPRELLREQKRFDDLILDLFTENPEQVILKQLHNASVYLRELAALRAYHASVRLHAIGLLDRTSESVLKQIIDKEPGSDFAMAAAYRLEHLGDNQGILSNLFHKS